MDIQNRLDQLRENVPGCDLATFGDLSSGLILKWAARSTCPREVLDRLAEAASANFGLLRPVPDGVQGDAGFGAAVIAFSDRTTQVFARAPGAPDDIIGVSCTPGTDCCDALTLAREAAERLADPS